MWIQSQASISLCLRTVPTYCLRVLGFCPKGLRLKSTCMEQLMMPVYGQAPGLTLICSTSFHNKWVWPEDGSEIFIWVYIVWLTNTIVSIILLYSGKSLTQNILYKNVSFSTNMKMFCIWQNICASYILFSRSKMKHCTAGILSAHRYSFSCSTWP